MVETPDCEWVGPLLAELATAAATGHDRAQALRHVAGCPTCRHDLAELARVADDLLLLVPEREPPPGFETAVAQRILSLGNPPRPSVARARPAARITSAIRRLAGAVPHRLPARIAVRVVTAATALALAASGGAAAAYWRATPDRQLADRYRQSIAASGGQYPTATPVTTASGTVVGHLFLYPGTPSWVMVALTAAPEPGSYTMFVLSTNGNRYPAGVCVVIDRAGTAGYPLPVPLAEIAAIELSRPGVLLTVHPT
jgi:hypothetical protein